MNQAGSVFHRGRTFDYIPRLVPANLNYLIRDAAPARSLPLDRLWEEPVWWTAGAVTDQGSEGACVGHGVTQEAMSSPVRQKFPKSTPDEVAFSIYKRAQKIDEWEGEDYDGTSVRAGLLVGREHEWWETFRWAKNIDDLRLGLNFGPVVIGVTWYEKMYETDDHGMVTIGGEEVGGHCLLVTGYSPSYEDRGRRFRWRNSWGRGYGKNGNGYIKPQDLNRVLFEEGNEAAVVGGRHLA